MGAPLGNQNAVKENRVFGEELRKVMAQGGRDRVRLGIERLLGVAEGGDQKALEFFADRLDGKPKQAIDHGLTDEPENPIQKLVAAAEELRGKIRGA